MSQVCLDRVAVPRLPKNLIVKRLTWDWNDPSEIVRQEILALKGTGYDICLYLNPMFKVVTSEPAREFFLEARKCQREWCRVLTQTIRLRQLEEEDAGYQGCPGTKDDFHRHYVY